jgi:hypothetical protein
MKFNTPPLLHKMQHGWGTLLMLVPFPNVFGFHFLSEPGLRGYGNPHSTKNRD